MLHLSYKSTQVVSRLILVMKVTFVAIVRKESEQSTNIAYTMEDGTGSIDVRQWLEQNHEESPAEKEKRAQIMSNYVRVVGRLTQFNNKTHVVAFQIRPIKNGNEISHHFLEAMLTHLQFTKGSAVSTVISFCFFEWLKF
jgi:replication factor A2